MQAALFLTLISGLICDFQYMDIDDDKVDKVKELFEESKLTYFKGPSRFSFFIKEVKNNSTIERSIVTTEITHFDYEEIKDSAKNKTNFHINLEIRLEEYILEPNHEEVLGKSQTYKEKLKEFQYQEQNQDMKTLWQEKNEGLDVDDNPTIGSSQDNVDLLALVIRDLLNQNGSEIRKALGILKDLIKKKDGYKAKTIKKTLKPLQLDDLSEDELPDKDCALYSLFVIGKGESQGSSKPTPEDPPAQKEERILFIFLDEILEKHICGGVLDLLMSRKVYEKRSPTNFAVTRNGAKDGRPNILTKNDLLRGYLDQDKRDGQVLGKMLRMKFGSESLFKNPALWAVFMFTLYVGIVVGSLVRVDSGSDIGVGKMSTKVVN